jgi:hypothetical protein
VKPGRFLLIVLYMGYLVNIGLMLILLPWSSVWGLVVTRFPTATASVIDSPWFRGTLSAFGALHLLLVVWELVHPTLLATTDDSGAGSQDSLRS